VGKYTYLQLVENRREGGKVRQRVLCTLGRVDVLAEKGGVDAVILSLAKFAEKVRLQEAYREGEILGVGERVVGPALIFGRLWEELGVRGVLEEALSGRKFTFPVERVVFASVLHRLFEGGSDRQCERFLRDVWVPGLGEFGLQHLYRAMRFLGEEKDRIEEGLFLRNRDLFSELRLVFFDTTSFYFHGICLASADQTGWATGGARSNPSSTVERGCGAENALPMGTRPGKPPKCSANKVTNVP